jgi:hypothetical protein
MARDGRGVRATDVQLTALRQRVEQWRADRPTREMPEELWSRAAELSATRGIHAVARALGLNSERLRRRAAGGLEQREREGAAATFLEVPLVAKPVESVVELSRRDGARMTIRVGQALEVVELLAAFLGQRR